MKLPQSKRLVLDTATGKYRIIEQISPKTDASRKLQMRNSKKQKVVRRSV